MRIRLLALPIAGLLALAGLSAAHAGGRAVAHRHAASTCPVGLLPLGPVSIADAVRPVLRAEPRSARPQVTESVLARDDPVRGAGARIECGPRTWRRTVVVYVDRRAFDSGPHRSASLSEGVYYVGRYAAGYRIWEIVH